jgi:outer membrane protein TolC
MSFSMLAATARPRISLSTGCAMLGPDYQQPTAPVESNWVETDDSLVNSESPTDPKWWQTAFQDLVLDELVEIALQENLTLRSAGLRVLQSQQQLAIAIGNQYPQQQQDLLTSTQGTVATNLVQVYRALGGGWEIRDNQDPADLLPAATRDEMRERTGYWKGVLE